MCERSTKPFNACRSTGLLFHSSLVVIRMVVGIWNSRNRQTARPGLQLLFREPRRNCVPHPDVGERRQPAHHYVAGVESIAADGGKPLMGIGFCPDLEQAQADAHRTFSTFTVHFPDLAVPAVKRCHTVVRQLNVQEKEVITPFPTILNSLPSRLASLTAQDNRLTKHPPEPSASAKHGWSAWGNPVSIRKHP